MLSWFVSQQGSNCRRTLLPLFSLTFHNSPDLIVIELKSVFTWKVLQHSSALLCGLILITTSGHPVCWHWQHKQCLSVNPHPEAELEKQLYPFEQENAPKHSGIHYTFRSLRTLQHFAGSSALLCAHSARCADVLYWSYGSIGAVMDASRRLTKHGDMVR